MEAEKSVAKYVIDNYGHLIRNEPPQFDEDSSLWISRLHSDYPVIIQNDQEKKREIHFIKADILGHVVLDKELRLVGDMTTTESELEERLSTYLDMWRSYAERIVISATADRVAQLSEVSTALNPIYEIINFILENDSVHLAHFEGRGPRRKRNMKHYFSILEDLNIIRKHEDRYVSGNLLAALRKETLGRSFSDLMNAVYAVVLRKKYAYLKQVIGQTSLETVIRVGNTIYYPELYSKGRVPRDRATLLREYENEYEFGITAPRLAAYLRKLGEIEVVAEEDGLYFGKDSLRDEMFSIQRSIQSPNEYWSISSPI